jgi:hypothetical protein
MKMTHSASDPSGERSDEYGQMTWLGQFCQKRPASADLLAERSNAIHLWDLGPESNPWAAVLYGKPYGHLFDGDGAITAVQIRSAR